MLFPIEGIGKWLVLSTIILFLTYMVWGVQHFREAKPPIRYIYLVAALGFALCLIGIMFLLHVHLTIVTKTLPLLNTLVFLYVLFGLIRYRNNTEKKFEYKGLVIRSGIFFLVSSFLTYPSIDFVPYRKVLIAFNAGNSTLKANLKMFDYRDLTNEAIASEDCDAAIEYALIANRKGKEWMVGKTGIDTLESEAAFKEFQAEYEYISATFTLLYEAYECKANALFAEKAYSEALHHYTKANEALYAYDATRPYWLKERALSFSKIGVCYYYMGAYAKADSLYEKAYQNYKEYVTDSLDTNVARILENLADSYQKQTYYEDSNTLYNTSANIREKDTLATAMHTDLVLDYLAMARNYLSLAEVPKSIQMSQKALAIADSTSLDFARGSLYYGLALYKQSKPKEAKVALEKALHISKDSLPANHQNIAEINYSLGITSILLADYPSADKYLKRGAEITLQHYDTHSDKYASYLKALALLEKEKGNYKEAKALYEEVFKIYKPTIDSERSDRMIDAMVVYADLLIELEHTKEALAYTDLAFKLLNKYLDQESSFVTPLWNRCADVYYATGNYKKADSLYNQTLGLLKANGDESFQAHAEANNGLALLVMAKGKYQKSDSLFTKAIAQERAILGEKHPYTAIMYYNQAMLQIAQHNLVEAKEFLLKSEVINHQFLKETHPMFADILVAYGDISRKERKNKEAKANYVKALKIYELQLPSTHSKIVGTRRKLAKL